MGLVFFNSAKKELENLPQDLKAIFLMHLEKIQVKPPRKHMKHGIP
jgi:phage-related protein